MSLKATARATSANQGRLEQALLDYLAAAEAGKAPPKEEFLAKFPQLAGDLEMCLASLEFLRNAAKGANSLGVAADAAASDGAYPGMIGEYRITKEVGRGGMGVVYGRPQDDPRRRSRLVRGRRAVSPGGDGSGYP